MPEQIARQGRSAKITILRRGREMEITPGQEANTTPGIGAEIMAKTEDGDYAGDRER